MHGCAKKIRRSLPCICRPEMEGEINIRLFLLLQYGGSTAQYHSENNFCCYATLLRFLPVGIVASAYQPGIVVANRFFWTSISLFIYAINIYCSILVDGKAALRLASVLCSVAWL